MIDDNNYCISNNIKEKTDKERYLRDCFIKPNLNFLIGSAFSYYEDDSRVLGISLISKLYDKITPLLNNKINSFKDKLTNEEQTMLEEILNSKDLEQLISFINMHGDKELSKEIKNNFILFILKESKVLYNDIIKIASSNLPINTNPILECYIKFILLLDDIVSNKNVLFSSNVINIFTTNYDIMFEWTLEFLNKNYYNGFLGFYNRVFNIKNYDYKFSNIGELQSFKYQYKTDFFNLIKLHGSLTWEIRDNSIYETQKLIYYYNDLILNIEEKIFDFINSYIIYPVSSKFESISYEFSYYEMYMYFKNKLLQENSQLIILGFSLKDEHLSKVISDSGSNLNVLIFCYSYNEYLELKDKFPRFKYVFPCEDYGHSINCFEWIEYIYSIIQSNNVSDDYIKNILKLSPDNLDCEENNNEAK